jgi:5-(carboxyamino)imidazole ribonucleotide synthase
MLNLLGPNGFKGAYAIRGLRKAFSMPGLNLHIYGKKMSKPRRKLGHITILGSSVEKALSNAEDVKKVIKIEHEKK